jgi:hypothetical protein
MNIQNVMMHTPNIVGDHPGYKSPSRFIIEPFPEKTAPIAIIT